MSQGSKKPKSIMALIKEAKAAQAPSMYKQLPDSIKNHPNNKSGSTKRNKTSRIYI